jgi:gliding motility-associated-like protein
MNLFEQHIKQSLNSFEAEYNPADWTDMQNRISKANAGKSANIGKGLLIAASVLATAGAIYYFSTSDTENNIISAEHVSKQPMVVANEKSVQPEENYTSQALNSTKKEQPAASVDAKKTSVQNNPVSSEKNDQPAVINTTENKINSQDQPKKEPVSEQPIQPASAAFSANFRPDMNKVCEGTAVHFIADNNDATVTYKWYFGDGTSSSEKNPAHTFAQAGVFNVKLHVTSKDKKQAEQKNTITVADVPSVRVDYTISDDNNMLVNFEAEGDKVTDWKWNFGDNKSSSVQNPAHTYSKKGNYPAELTAKNSTGCVTVVKKDVNLKNELNLLAPNGFSPDGDGINDTWMPAALLNGDYIFTLTILDKSGKVVFRTSDKNNVWDGQGAKAGDTYKWIVVVKEKNGEIVFCKDQGQGLITIAE